MTEAHAARAHATYAPSAAHRWLKCPGSIAMSEGISETPSVFAAEGTAAHQLAEACLRGGFDADRFEGHAINIHAAEPYPVRGLKADGVSIFEVADEMIDAVQVYLDVCNELRETSTEFDIEQRLDMSDILPGTFGTGDTVAYNEPEQRITIVDLKYGKGVAVEVEENEQELTYALGVAQRYHNRGVREIELIIVQPRAPHRDGPVRKWRTDVVTLYEHAIAMQKAAGETHLRAGEWCKFCKAAAFCGELRRRALEILGAEEVGGEIVKMSDPQKVPFKDWRQEQGEINLVKDWLKRREEYAHSEALAGRLPPNAKLVNKRAIRKWRDEDEAVETLKLAGVPDDDLFEVSLRSPAQIEKALPKKDRKLLDTLVVKQSSGTVLAPLDDPRDAVKPEDALGFTAYEMES